MDLEIFIKKVSYNELEDAYLVTLTTNHGRRVTWAINAKIISPSTMIVIFVYRRRDYRIVAGVDTETAFLLLTYEAASEAYLNRLR